ncbi:Crp/Fnr family transcriptional regulator [Mucilaginibacter defluvii]|uniref:Crp/Fnr family transcriptional regulator n=1 Tax=Mucilaginibacter defluvii TaxID=1196019 RepID=A0ABP9G374_9SPHI
MFDVLARYLTEKENFTPEDLAAVKQVAIPRRLRKRQYLLHEGTVSKYNCFVVSGCLRLFRIGDDGSEHILRFAVENWWIADYESYNFGEPAKGNVDALVDSEVLMISKADMDALCQNIPAFKRMKDLLDARCFDASQNRIFSSISQSAEERYFEFIKKHPLIHRRVPLHMIASYLGVSRETLSRVRHQNVKLNS